MTANRIFYLIALLLSIVSVLVFGNSVAGIMLYAVIFVPIISFILQLLAFTSLRVRQSVSRKTLYKNEKVRVRIYARCDRAVSFGFIDVRMNRPVENPKKLKKADAYIVNCFGMPGQTVFDIVCPNRGVYYVGTDTIRMYDMLGLFCLKKKIKPCKITVYPRVYSVTGIGVDSRLINQTSITLNALKKDDMLVSHVRPYQINDNPRTIHWKATAKMNEIMVKNYEPLKEVGIIVALDLMNKPSDDRALMASAEDRMLECAISLVANALADNLTARVVYYDKGGMCDRHVDELQDYSGFYNLMACVKFDGETDVVNLVDKIISEHIGGANVMVVTDRTDADLRRSLRESIGAGYKTALVCVTYSDEDRQKRQEEIRGIMSDGVSVAVVTANGKEPIAF